LIEYISTLIAITALSIFLIFSKVRGAYLIFPFLILTSLAGLRSEIGWDYDAYQEFFDQVASQAIGDSFSKGNVVDEYGFEGGFSLIIWLLTYLGVNYQFVLAFLTVGACLLAAYFISPSKGLALFLIVYLWYGYYHNFSILRQGLAAGLVFLAIALWETRKKQAFGVVALATTIHMSTIILAPFVAICIKYATKKIIIISLAFCWILSIISLGSDIISSLLGMAGRERWQALIGSSEMTTKVGVSLILVEYTLLTICAAAVDNNNPALRFAKGILLYRIITYGIFNDITIAWERTSSFSDPMYAMAIAILITYCVEKFSRNEILRRGALVSVGIGMSIYVAIKYERMLETEPRVPWERSHHERFIPYRSIFDK